MCSIWYSFLEVSDINCFLFDGLTLNQTENIKNMLGLPVEVPKGNELYKNGQICILKKGSATIRRLSSGHPVTVRTAKCGEVFGVASVFGECEQSLSSIIANDTCTVYYLNEELLKKLISDYPIIGINYISFLTDRIRFLNKRIDTFSADNTESRVYEFFLSQADNNGKVVLNFGMAELSRRLNIGRTSLYRSIETLEKSGLITRNKNTVEILKGEKL